MSTADTMGADSASKMPEQTRTEELVDRYGKLVMMDDLIRLRAADDVQTPILAYPHSRDNGRLFYEYFTGRDLDRLVDGAARALMDEYGLKPVSQTQPSEQGHSEEESSGNSRSIVAIFSLSNLDMIATFFALTRLGYTIMMLSPRLAAPACVYLLDTVGCDTIICGQTASIQTTAKEILQLKKVACYTVPPRSISSTDAPSTTSSSPSGHATSDVRSNILNPEETALIMHSSGTTGTPKPLFISHSSIMGHPLRGPGLTSLNTLPWYHTWGISTAFQAMWQRRTAFVWDASLPITGENLVKALREANPESVSAVPYVLQLLADTEGGIETLRKCKLVVYGSAHCPDELGDRLVQAGVKIGGCFGL